ncbi:MAG: DUF4126 domain-containing protein [Gammaproteobacteria bacterium]|nr:DUF4126 domain-containing protein [Gammaproteobacteria bacterium]
MEAVALISLAMGTAWASGINLYAAVFMLGILGSSGHVVLPPELEVLTDPLVITAAGFMYCVEFFTDKVPGVDTGWDAIHSFIRIPAGAVLAAGAMAEVGPAAELAGFLIGGSLAATSHITKAGGRVLINTSPEPVSNWTASLAEDLAVIAGLWTALNHPVVFLVLLGVFLILAVWLLPRIWRGVKFVGCRIARLFGGCKEPAPTPEPDGSLTDLPSLRPPEPGDGGDRTPQRP